MKPLPNMTVDKDLLKTVSNTAFTSEVLQKAVVTRLLELAMNESCHVHYGYQSAYNTYSTKTAVLRVHNPGELIITSRELEI